MKNQTQIDFDGARMVFDAEPIKPTPRCSMTSADMDILINNMLVTEWAAYMVTDGTDLTAMLHAELDKNDGVMAGFPTVAAATSFRIWMMCEATEDCRFESSVY